VPRGQSLRGVRRERGTFCKNPGISGNTVDDSEDRTLRSRTSGDCPVVLLISADSELEVLAGELDGSNTESCLLRNISDVESLATRNGFRSPDLVFVDLDSCEGRVDVVSLVRRTFPLASLVALARSLDDAQKARLLEQDVPSLIKPVSAGAFVGLAARLSRRQSAPETSDSASLRRGTGRLDALLEAYSSVRGLSPQQRFILRLHLAGNNDKEIAFTCSCSEATVYEHWRRMARKAGGMHKGCVINDFHKFLDR
jgi:DNA-binding NarL/FixJ family response regulator